MTLITNSIEIILLLSENQQKMKPRKVGILLGTALFLILGQIAARPTEDQLSNSTKSKQELRKTQQDGPKRTQTKLGLRDTSKGKHKKTRVIKPLKKEKTFSPLKDGNKERKRQFIMHPPHSFAHPYMFMRPPPMTQRTIVTTRIPRPPMAIPYNPFFSRSFLGGMHHSHFPFYDPMAQMYGGEEDEEEEGK